MPDHFTQTTEVNNYKCFVVEDSVRIRTRVIALMESIAGVKVVGFSDTASESIEWLRTHDWDAVIIDLNINSGSGITILEYLRNPEFLNKKKVVLTNYGFPEVKARCFELGATAFFDKSTEIEGLLELLEEEASSV